MPHEPSSRDALRERILDVERELLAARVALEHAPEHERPGIRARRDRLETELEVARNELLSIRLAKLPYEPLPAASDAHRARLVVLILALLFAVSMAAYLGLLEPARVRLPWSTRARAEAAGASPAPQSFPGAPVAAGAGVVRGRVVFEGRPPAIQPPDAVSEPACASRARRAPIVRVGARFGLRDAIVTLDVPAQGAPSPPAEPLVLDRSGCMFAPRTAVLASGQALELRNGDPVLHVARARAGESALWSARLPPGAVERKVLAGLAPRAVVELACDVHPWERAHLVVGDPRLARATPDDGAFAFEDVAAGAHTVSAWHPDLGTKLAEVLVHAGTAADVVLTYRPGDARTRF